MIEVRELRKGRKNTMRKYFLIKMGRRSPADYRV